MHGRGVSLTPKNTVRCLCSMFNVGCKVACMRRVCVRELVMLVAKRLGDIALLYTAAPTCKCDLV